MNEPILENHLAEMTTSSEMEKNNTSNSIFVDMVVEETPKMASFIAPNEKETGGLTKAKTSNLKMKNSNRQSHPEYSINIFRKPVKMNDHVYNHFHCPKGS